MPRKKQPAEGGAVGVGEESSSNPVRGPIKDMLAGGSEADFKESLPEETASGDLQLSPEESATPRRKRRSKAEMEKDRKESGPVDKRLERAKGKCVGLGGAGIVTAGFSMAGKGLNDTEQEDVEDQFYLISCKSGANADSWLFIIIYTICLIAKLVMVRTEMGEEVQEWLKKMFEPKPVEQRKGV
jgi:hypothetical protein